MANAPVNYLLPVLQQETLIKLSGSHRREAVEIEGGLVDKGFLTGERGLGVKTTKILYINVGNCQRVFEKLKIDDNALASLPVQTKKSMKSMRFKGSWVSRLQSPGTGIMRGCQGNSVWEPECRGRARKTVNPYHMSKHSGSCVQN